MADSHDDDFRTFLRERERASTAFVNGDATALTALSTRQAPASIFGPKGDCIDGADAVNSANAHAAASFDQGSTNTLTTLHESASGELGCWVGIQESQVRIKGKAAPAPFRLRVTELYRREGGAWKLFHRHADPMADDKQ